MQSISEMCVELLSAGLVALWAVCITLRGLVKNLVDIVNQVRRPAPPPLTSSAPRGLEWRAIRPIGSRVLAVRLQVVYA
jgi:hypothetical protein